MNEIEPRRYEVTMSTGDYVALVDGNTKLGILLNAFDQSMGLSSWGNRPTLDEVKLLNVFQALFPVKYQNKMNQLLKEAENDQDQG